MASSDKEADRTKENAGQNKERESTTPLQQGHPNDPEAIKPGLAGLNLNILLALDMHMINHTKSHLMKDIEKQHYVVKDILQNMISLLKTKIPREKVEARLELEELVKQNYKNLNALADLEYIYRELNRISAADKCKDKIDAVLLSKDDDDVLSQQTCLLEQGYAILIERTLVNENTLELRISDLQKILNTEQERSEGMKKKCLLRGLHHQVQVLRNVQNANEHDSIDPHLYRKGSSLQKFEAAERLRQSYPHPIWNFYYGKALNQYCDSMETVIKYKIQEDSTEMENERKRMTIKAIEKFWQIIQHYNGDDMDIFKARSYAYVGHILTTRGKLLTNDLCTEFDFFSQVEFQTYLSDSLLALKQAFEMKPDDVTVLNRYGRSLWNKSRDDKLKDVKNEHLSNADKMLSASIKLDATENWWAFSCRMHVLLHLADTKQNVEEKKKILERARDDGLVCFKTRHTRSDMSILAEIFEKLAKFPDIQKYGPEYVREEELLYKALDYLFYASHLGDPVDYKWTHRIACCLFDLGEYEQAVEWQRKSWFLSAPTLSTPFMLLCQYMLTLFEKRNLWRTANNYVFKELLYIMLYGKKKYGMDITKTISMLYYRKQDEFCKFFKEVLVEREIKLRNEEIDIIKQFLDIFIDKSTGHRNNDNFKSLATKLDTVVPVKDTEYQLSDIFQQATYRPLEKG